MRSNCVRKTRRGARYGALMMSTALVALFAVPSLVYAEAKLKTSVLAQAKSVDLKIPAQSLTNALALFGRQSGMQVSVDAELIRNKNTSGVSGEMSVQDGLARLLAGTGLTFRMTDTNTAQLEALPAADNGVIMLNPVNVEGQAVAMGATTEGTDSYTTGSANTSTGLNLSLRETPQSMSVITRARIDDQAIDEIGDVLDETVGISANRTTGLGTDGVNYYSRGFEVQNYQVDGIARPTSIYGFEVTTSDMAAYDRVEIVRGASGLMNGVGNPSATVNLVRKRPTAESQAYFKGQTGSWDRYRVEGDVSGSLVEGDKLRGRLVSAYQENDSFVDREHLEKKLLYGIVEADVTEDTVLTFGLEYQEFENSGAARSGLPLVFTDGSKTDLPRSTNVGTEWSNFQNDTMNIFSGIEHTFDNQWLVAVNAEYSHRHYDELMGFLNGSNAINKDTGAGAKLYAARWAGELEQYSIDARANGPVKLFEREHEFMFGVNYSLSQDHGPNYPGWWSGNAYSATFPNAFTLYETGVANQPYLGPTGSHYGGDIQQSALFGATRLNPMDDLAVILGSRVANWKEREFTQANSQAERQYKVKTNEKNVWVPYAGVVVDLTDQLSTYVGYTEIFNPQTNQDASGSALPPTVGASYETGLKAEFYGGALNASAALFRIEQDNFAVAIPGAVTPSGGQAYRAASGTTSEGFEIEVSGEVLPGLQVGGGFNRTDVKDNNDDPLLTNIPRSSFKMFTSYRFSDDLEGLTVGGNVRWQGRTSQSDTSNLWPNNDSFVQGAVTTVDLMARYKLSDVTLALNINNVFDEKYYSGLSYSGRYGETRSATLSAKYDF